MNDALSAGRYRFPEKLIDRCFAVILLLIVAVCLFCSGMTYAMKLEGTWSNFICLPVGAAILALLAVSAPLPARGDPARFRRRMLCLSLAAGVFLYLLASQTAVFCPWDGEALYTGSRDLAAGEGSELLNTYLSVYQNNRLLTFLEELVWFVTLAIGKTNAYVLMLPLQIAMITVCIHLMFVCAEMTCGRERPAVSAFVWLLAFVFIGLNPMITQNYSDIPAMLLIACCAYFTLCIRFGRHRVRHLFLLGLLSLFGYSLKPQVTFVLIAAVLTVLLPEGIRHIRQYRRWLVCAASLLCGLVLGFAGAEAAVNSLPLQLNREAGVGIPHYLMLGLDTETMGMYSQEDYWISTSYATKAERTAGTLQLVAERVKEAGAGNMALLFLRKLLTNYNDGSFAWYYTIRGGEIINWCDMPLTIPGLSAAIRDFYTGSGFTVFQGLAQSVWLALLVLAALGGLRSTPDGLSVLRLAVLGLTLFQEIFEASPRYLYAYAPVYCLLAGGGLAYLLSRRKSPEKA